MGESVPCTVDQTVADQKGTPSDSTKVYLFQLGCCDSQDTVSPVLEGCLRCPAHSPEGFGILFEWLNKSDRPRETEQAKYPLVAAGRLLLLYYWYTTARIPAAARQLDYTFESCITTQDCCIFDYLGPSKAVKLSSLSLGLLGLKKVYRLV